MSHARHHTPHQIQDLLAFLDDSPTAWHAVANCACKLSDAGFTELFEADAWKLEPGGRYFVIKNGSSLCAFIVPTGHPKSLRLAASHTDSPGFKLKPSPEYRKENMLLFGLEIYGAPLLTSWLNRDLGLAGRIVFTNKKGHLEQALVNIDDYPLSIPQLALHLDREVNESGIVLNKQDHLAALVALDPPLSEKDSYLEMLLKEQVPFKKLLAHDLFLYPLDPARLIGYHKQLISSYRIDSLCSVHGVLTGLLHAAEEEDTTIRMAVFWDNEEIGSSTAQGADSPFLSRTLERVAMLLRLNREDFFRLLTQSLCVSVDLSHALHPNYPEKHEPRHQLFMDKGITIKYSASHRYATDASSAAPIAQLCDKLGLQYQTFVSRSDIRSGSTIGPIHASIAGMPTVDIGTPQLSMHSARELTSCQDHLDLCKLMKAYYEGS